MIKCCLLLAFIGAGFAFSAGAGKVPKPSPSNFNPAISFDGHIEGGAGGKVYGYSQSLLLVIFAYSGYENANYILGEIDQPKRIFKWASMLSLSFVTLLYMLTNIAYFLVLGKDDFKNQGTQLALQYARNIFGTNFEVRNVVAGFIAFSSFGNIIVVTFVSARVKQEIAKEGVLPWSRIIASDMQTPFSWLRSKLRSTKASKSDEENTPIAALFLHWLFSFILIVSPNIKDTYNVLLLLHSYGLQALVGFFLGIGLVHLYLKPGSTWGTKSGFRPIGGWLWAAFFALVNLFLIIVPWIPPPSETVQFHQLIFQSTQFYVYPTVAVSLMGFGVIYWFAFAKIYPRIIKKELKVNRVPIIQQGVQIYEAVFFNWVIPGGVLVTEEAPNDPPDRTEEFGNQPRDQQAGSFKEIESSGS
ncbi:hypothetical protein Q9L58_006374 [Maublancomyces gigas]|uniref:Amino acid transporter n=1 Tax=Discina gigas TaxID=1032678 RepID=A0ABR3GFJ1_9PEZI